MKNRGFFGFSRIKSVSEFRALPAFRTRHYLHGGESSFFFFNLRGTHFDTRVHVYTPRVQPEAARPEIRVAIAHRSRAKRLGDYNRFFEKRYRGTAGGFEVFKTNV